MIVSWCCAHCLICEDDFPLMGIVDSRSSLNIDPLLVGKFNRSRSRSLLHEKSGSAQETLAPLPLVENVPE
jgi:hypothetical protein